MANPVMTLGGHRGLRRARPPRGTTLNSNPELAVHARLAAMATAARPALLERERELGELLAAARDAERGRGRLVVIEGPAGIGKTRLLREACDRAALRFLSFLAPRLEDLPVLLVVATRPAADDAALARLATDPTARLLRPRTLSAAAVAELVHAAFAGAASDEYCAAVEHVTGGNPFLVHELLAQLAAEARP